MFKGNIMYGDNHKVQLDSSDELFNMIDDNEFFSILTDLEESSDYNDSITIYEYFGMKD